MKRESPEEYNARMRCRYSRDREAQFIQSHQGFKTALELLRGKKRRNVHAREGLDADLCLLGLFITANSEPDVAETMTGSERKKLVKTISDSVETLRVALLPFGGGERDGFRWPFQPYFDKLALDISLDDAERWKRDGEDSEDIEHRTRYAVYHLLMRRMDWFFEAILAGAEHFAETETIIKKPNDPNAKRLLFLRNITRLLVREFGSPCRAAALALASIHYDCTDLDEAAVSKLAPVIRPKPVEIEAEEFESMAAAMERSIEVYASRPGVSDEAVNELKENLKKMRETAYSIQPN